MKLSRRKARKLIFSVLWNTSFKIRFCKEWLLRNMKLRRIRKKLRRRLM